MVQSLKSIKKDQNIGLDKKTQNCSSNKQESKVPEIMKKMETVNEEGDINIAEKSAVAEKKEESSREKRISDMLEELKNEE